MGGMLKRRSSEEVGILEKIVSGIPQVVKAIEDLPVDQLWSALEVAEGSYRRTLRQFGFSASGRCAQRHCIFRCLHNHWTYFDQKCTSQQQLT
jgi:hypothetical protein